MQNKTSAATEPKRRVVDAFTRVLHALMAITFGLAYITSEMDGLRLVHVTLGYTLGLVFATRVFWGLVGPRRVHLRVLIEKLRGLSDFSQYLQRYDWRSVLHMVLAVTVVALLALVLPVITSGYITYFKLLGQWTEEVHEVFGNIMLLLVSCHVAAIVLLSLGKSERQIRPMLTGYVTGKGPNLVTNNMMAVAIAFLLLIVSLWTWQAYQYIHDPQLTEQPSWLHPVGGYQEEDDD